MGLTQSSRGVVPRARLASDSADSMLPQANRVRIEEALAEVEASAKKTGKKIGCALPAR